MNETKAYLEGRNAGYNRAENLRYNPSNHYPTNTLEFLEWEDGFFDAQKSIEASSTHFLSLEGINQGRCICRCVRH